MKKSYPNSLNSTKSKGSLKKLQQPKPMPVPEEPPVEPVQNIEQVINDMKPQVCMGQLQSQANQKLNSMNTHEIEQHHRIDMKYRTMEAYQFETQLRELVADCVQPIRDRLVQNSQKIVDIVRFNAKVEQDIDKLEVIYNNIKEFEEQENKKHLREIKRKERESKKLNAQVVDAVKIEGEGEGQGEQDVEVRSSSEESEELPPKWTEKPHLTIFDTIRNKLASNASKCRTNEQLLITQVENISMQNSEAQSKVKELMTIIDTLHNTIDINRTEMAKLQEQMLQFRVEITHKFDEMGSDTTAKFNQMRVTSRTQQDQIIELRSVASLNKEVNNQQDRLIEVNNSQIETLLKTVEILKISKQDEKTFLEMRKDIVEKVNRSQAKIEDVNNKIESTDNYLARYLPFNQFIQVMQVYKQLSSDQLKVKKFKEQVDNFEQYKMKQLYEEILFDDGRAPKKFAKDHLEVDREQINNKLKQDVRITSRNLRAMKATQSSSQQKRHTTVERVDDLYQTSPSPQKRHTTTQKMDEIVIKSQDQAKHVTIVSQRYPQQDNLYKDQEKGSKNLSMSQAMSHGGHQLSNISSELQDKIDDLQRIKPKAREQYGPKVDLQSEIIDELLPPGAGDGEDSQITFNVNNLNYVKKKLFDPEIQYLTQKFKEQLMEQSKVLQQQQFNLYENYKIQSHEEIQTYKIINEKNQQDSNYFKTFQDKITQVVDKLIMKFELYDQEINNLKYKHTDYQRDLSEIFKSLGHSQLREHTLIPTATSEGGQDQFINESNLFNFNIGGKGDPIAIINKSQRSPDPPTINRSESQGSNQYRIKSSSVQKRISRVKKTRNDVIESGQKGPYDELPKGEAQFYNSFYGNNQFDEQPQNNSYSTLKHLPLKKSAFKPAFSMGKLLVSGNTMPPGRRTMNAKNQTQLMIKNKDIIKENSDYQSSINNSAYDPQSDDMKRKSTLRQSVNN